MPTRCFIPFILAATLATPAFAQVAPTGDMVGRLMEADSDHDGRITRAEALAWRTRQWARLDRNGDGWFTRDDLPGLLASRWDAPRLTALRTAFDTDHDGRVSRAEFINGPMPGFDMADTDHDDVVTAAEIEAAKARLAARKP